MIECEAVLRPTSRGVPYGEPIRCGGEWEHIRHRHDWSCEVASGLGYGHDPIYACHPFQWSRTEHGLHTWKKKPRIGRKVVTDHWDSDGKPTRIVNLREDTTFEDGVAARFLKPDGTRSMPVSISWLVPVK